MTLVKYIYIYVKTVKNYLFIHNIGYSGKSSILSRFFNSFFAFKVLQRQDCSINSGNSQDPVVDRWCPGGGMSKQI